VTDAERIARSRVDDAVDRLVRCVVTDGERSASAERARMFVGQTIDRLVRLTRETVAASPSSAERAADD
jgi:hypothetical protein